MEKWQDIKNGNFKDFFVSFHLENRLLISSPINGDVKSSFKVYFVFNWSRVQYVWIKG